jgi:hypothetical protein
LEERKAPPDGRFAHGIQLSSIHGQEEIRFSVDSGCHLPYENESFPGFEENLKNDEPSLAVSLLPFLGSIPVLHFETADGGGGSGSGGGDAEG